MSDTTTKHTPPQLQQLLAAISGARGSAESAAQLLSGIGSELNDEAVRSALAERLAGLLIAVDRLKQLAAPPDRVDPDDHYHHLKTLRRSAR